MDPGLSDSSEIKDVADPDIHLSYDTKDSEEDPGPSGPPKKAFLEKCKSHDECESGWCSEGKDGMMCSRTCEDDCPENMTCRTMLIFNEEPIDLCTDAHLTLCRPCDFKSDCTNDTQFPDAICQSWGPEGSYCLTPCHEKENCPEGYGCTEFKFGGDFDYFCTPDNGQCECDGFAIDTQLSTRCSNPTSLGNCDGIRYCSIEGLTDCDARLPDSEICNGDDDDCDGDIDEGFADCDGDGIKDCVDADRDNDGILEDGDGSGVAGDAPCSAGNNTNCDDNCGPCIKNPDQLDLDGNAIGDLCEVDEDNDGFSYITGDCDDTDGTVNPNAQESCNGKDDDCDGAIDEEGATECTTFMRDEDQDGFGLEDDSRCLCEAADFFTAKVGGDCNDLDPKIFPENVESCDGLDNNCDGNTDPPESEGCTPLFPDLDKDGFGNKDAGSCLCAYTEAYTTTDNTDCNDENPAVNIQSAEVCNGIDDDCDGGTDLGPGKLQQCPANCLDDLECAKSCNINGQCFTSCGDGQLVCFQGQLQPCDAPDLTFCKAPETGCTQDYSVCGDCPYKSEGVCDGVDNDCDWNTDEDFSLQQDCDLGLGSELCAGSVSCDKGTILCEPKDIPNTAPPEMTGCLHTEPSVQVTPISDGAQGTHQVWLWTPSSYTQALLSYSEGLCAGSACAQQLSCGGKLWSWGPIKNNEALQKGDNTLEIYAAEAGNQTPISCEDKGSEPISTEIFNCPDCD